MTAYDPSIEDAPGRGQRPQSDEATIAVLVARMGDVLKAMDRLSDEVKSASRNSVSRGEWTQRNEAVNSRFESHGREIAQIRVDLASRRTPWTAVAGAVTGAGSLLIVLIQNIQG